MEMDKTSRYSAQIRLLVGLGSALIVAFLLFAGYAHAGLDARPTAQANVVDRYEVNDFYTQTKIIVDASPVISLTFCRSGGCSANDPDWYAFNVNPNTVLNLTAASTQLLLSARAFLTNGTTPVGSAFDSIGASTVIVTNSSANIQQYFVRITNNSGINAVYSLGYVLSAIPPAPPGPGPDAYEPNDTIAEASVPAGPRLLPSFILSETPITALSFTPYTGRTDVGDAADWFMFFGRAGSIYQFVTRDVRPGVETILAVFSPGGASLLPALSGSSNPNNRYITGRRGSRVVVQTPTSGTYWVRVTNIDTMPRIASMTYTLAMDELARWPLLTTFIPTWQGSQESNAQGEQIQEEQSTP